MPISATGQVARMESPRSVAQRMPSREKIRISVDSATGCFTVLDVGNLWSLALFFGDLHEPRRWRIERNLHVGSGGRRVELGRVRGKVEIHKGRDAPVANDSLTQHQREKYATCAEDTRARVEGTPQQRPEKDEAGKIPVTNA